MGGDGFILKDHCEVEAEKEIDERHESLVSGFLYKLFLLALPLIITEISIARLLEKAYLASTSATVHTMATSGVYARANVNMPPSAVVEPHYVQSEQQLNQNLAPVVAQVINGPSTSAYVVQGHVISAQANSSLNQDLPQAIQAQPFFPAESNTVDNVAPTGTMLQHVSLSEAQNLNVAAESHGV